METIQIQQPVEILKGHKEPVTSLSLSPSENLLLSGSQDCTVRIWDLTTKKVIKAIKDCFKDDQGNKSEINSVCFSTINENDIYVASNHRIYYFDLSNTSMIITKPDHIFDFNLDEINEIKINDKGNFLAAGDDFGVVYVIDLETKKLVKKPHNGHDNICTCMEFRPKNKWEVWSGGMDCKLLKWDISRGTQTRNFNMVDFTNDPKSLKIINPPFVHSISISPDGHVISAGLGDGSIQFLKQVKKDGNKKKSKSEWDTIWRVKDAHSWIASTVSFISSCFLISGGNDGKISLWEIPGNTSEVLEPTNKQTLSTTLKVNCLAATKYHENNNSSVTNDVTMFVGGVPVSITEKQTGDIHIYKFNN